MHLTPSLRADAITVSVRGRPRAVLHPLWAWLACGLLVLALVGGSRARAQQPLLGPDALNGGRYVGSALAPARPSLRIASTVGYGFTESVLAKRDRHHRVAGELALALVVAPWLQASLGGELRVDHHRPDGVGDETGVLGSAQIATRHVLAIGERFGLGFTPKVYFPGADAGRRFKAASYDLSLLASARLSPLFELSLSAGYRFDRTRYAFKRRENQAQVARLAAGLSEQNAALLGALGTLSHSTYRVAVEWSWELALNGHVHARNSPMRLRAAFQRVFSERYLPGIELGVDTSTRPVLIGLRRIEPRLWLRIGLTVILERTPPPRKEPEKKIATPAPVIAPQAVAMRTVTVRILDTAGRPVVGAHIAVPREAEHEEYTTDAQGLVTLELPEGVTAVTIEAEGYEPQWRTLSGAQAQDQSLVLRPGLPPAEIKGVVRNLGGDPLRASVTVLPEGLTVSTDAQGQFAVGVAPGDHTLRIVADGYEPQERPAQVEQSGVTIVVVDLRKATK